MSKPKRIPVALLKGAHAHGRKAAQRLDERAGPRAWSETSEAEQAGFRAFARYILKHQPK